MPQRSSRHAWPGGFLYLLCGVFLAAIHLQNMLSLPVLAQQLTTPLGRKLLVTLLGGELVLRNGILEADVSLLTLLVVLSAVSIPAWLGFSALLSRRYKNSGRIPELNTFDTSAATWGRAGWRFWLTFGAWEAAWLIAGLSGWQYATSLLASGLIFVHGFAWGGWLAAAAGLWFIPANRSLETQTHVAAPTTTQANPLLNWRSSMPAAVWICMAVYSAVFCVLNWRLYETLLMPHGDTVMYEEHLWNLLHGKGFRSYLDGGRLFLGEHIQVIHLAFLPLYLLWPSHLLLEFGQSILLALGAIPVFRLTLRHSGSKLAGVALCIAYLLYFPMQSLDIADDFKTFRPNGFEIPAFLFALDALERRAWRTMVLHLAIALACQEDAACIVAPLGLWLLVRGSGDAFLKTSSDNVALPSPTEKRDRRNARIIGAALMLFGCAYVLWATQLAMPYFRSGAAVHYTKYFSGLGDSTSEILLNMLRKPGIVLERWFDAETVLFALALLAPLAGLPLGSPGRLFVGMPLFAVLALNEISRRPVHHFHAPIVPVLFWAAAAATGIDFRLWNMFSRILAASPFRSSHERSTVRSRDTDRSHAVDTARSTAGTQPALQASPRETGKSLPTEQPSESSTGALLQYNPGRGAWRAFIAAGTAAGVGLFTTCTPLGFNFWTPDSRAYWQNLYVAGPRAAMLPRVLKMIPSSSRVASTDFVHPRFTHYERSYDYSDYRPDVPADADWIVIDTAHPYSQIKRPDQVKELRLFPNDWELVPDFTDGYFIVIKRRKPQPEPVNGNDAAIGNAPVNGTAPVNGAVPATKSPAAKMPAESQGSAP